MEYKNDLLEYNTYGDTLPEAYHKALYLLRECGELVDCPDYNTTQKELSMTIEIQNPLREPMISKLFVGDPHSLEQYRQEILDGILDFEVERGNWHYTYHQRMANQIGFIIDELRRNPDSRRAVIDVRTSEDMGDDSPACLQNIQYMIRRNKLNCKVLFRSNDACKASFMNMFALIMLQKRIADELGIEVGSYTHRANSFHCYERDFAMLDGYVKRIESTGDWSSETMFDNEDLCYYYEGDWDEQMEDEQASIAEFVEKLKKGE